MSTPLIWYNLKLTVHYSWCLSVVLLAVIPFFMDAGLMGQNEVARLGERLISFLGLIVYPHLALLENGELVSHSTPSRCVIPRFSFSGGC
ncbi:hypothetical protein JI735_21385 [Paenibacillus sonchi]|uniref:Uncharacterized protein n=2 Tax=Paenibacillus sonchi TaxID=373687 RepID=A0A974SBK2_9BACL|nr:hypothetical protein JI735_21385 [Paenibacillus sonchi]